MLTRRPVFCVLFWPELCLHTTWVVPACTGTLSRRRLVSCEVTVQPQCVFVSRGLFWRVLPNYRLHGTQRSGGGLQSSLCRTSSEQTSITQLFQQTAPLFAQVRISWRLMRYVIDPNKIHFDDLLWFKCRRFCESLCLISFKQLWTSWAHKKKLKTLKRRNFNTIWFLSCYAFPNYYNTGAYFLTCWHWPLSGSFHIFATNSPPKGPESVC